MKRSATLNYITLMAFFLPKLVLLAGIGPQDPIVLRAEYNLREDIPSWSFPLFYGYINENLDQMTARIDFYYDKTIFISDDLNPQGINCGIDFECTYLEKETYIVENTRHKLIATHEAGVPLYLSPFLGALQPYALPKLQFYLNLVDTSFTELNTIGINPGSVFWSYLALGS